MTRKEIHRTRLRGSGARWIGYWTRRPFKFALPHLDMIPDPRTPHRETRRSNSLPDGPNKHVVFKFQETSLVKAKWLRPRAQIQKSRDYPLLDLVFARHDDSLQRFGRFYATDGQVADACETPSSRKLQDRGPLFERAFLQGIVISKQTFRTYVCS